MRRATALLAVGGILVLAGCAGIGSESPSATTPTDTATTTTTAGTTTSATTTTAYSRVGDNPDYGTELLSVTPTTEANAMQANASHRFDFQNLSRERQRVFLAALERDCNLVQDVFRLANDGGIFYVQHDGSWYLLRVSVV